MVTTADLQDPEEKEGLEAYEKLHQNVRKRTINVPEDEDEY